MRWTSLRRPERCGRQPDRFAFRGARLRRRAGDRRLPPRPAARPSRGKGAAGRRTIGWSDGRQRGGLPGAVPGLPAPGAFRGGKKGRDGDGDASPVAREQRRRTGLDAEPALEPGRSPEVAQRGLLDLRERVVRRADVSEPGRPKRVPRCRASARALASVADVPEAIRRTPPLNPGWYGARADISRDRGSTPSTRGFSGGRTALVKAGRPPGSKVRSGIRRTKQFFVGVPV